MAELLKLLCLSFFLAIVVNGQEQCTIKDLKVSQMPTGKKVAGKPEFNVTVTNTCVCTALNVKLSCAAFRSAGAERAVMSKSGDTCLLNNGSPIYGGASSGVSFKYAWIRTFSFSPLSADFACS